MTTSPTDKIDSADYREHYHRALAQTLSDEQMTAQGIRDLTQTLSDSEAQKEINTLYGRENEHPTKSEEKGPLKVKE